MRSVTYNMNYASGLRYAAAGQLTEDRDYRQLFTVYLNLDGKEREAATVIDEGLAKNILKGDHNTYLALAQSYYFSEQMPQAIDAYKKAAPLDDDGETYLNLARALWAADRVKEAKEAAQQAIGKGRFPVVDVSNNTKITNTSCGNVSHNNFSALAANKVKTAIYLTYFNAFFA